VDVARVQRCLAVTVEALAELQSSGIRPHARLAFDSQLAELTKDRRILRGPLAKQHPAMADYLEHLLDRLVSLCPAVEELVPAHGAFRHKQTIGDESSLTLIDWDGLCMADAAVDAASFLLRLRQVPLLAPGTAPDMITLAEEFRREVLVRLPRVTDKRLALYEGLSLTEAAMRLCRRASARPGVEVQVWRLAVAAGEALDSAEALRA
jgi:hypothetical protein